MESFSCRGRALERPESGGIRRDVASAVPYEASTETIRRAGGESPPLHRLSKRPSPHYVNHPTKRKRPGHHAGLFFCPCHRASLCCRLPRCRPPGDCCVVVTNCGPRADPPHRNAFPSAGSEWRTGGADPLSLHRRRSPQYRPRFRKRGRHAQ